MSDLKCIGLKLDLSIFESFSRLKYHPNIVMIALLVLDGHPKLRVVVDDSSQLDRHLKSILKHQGSGEDCLPELRELANFSLACRFCNQVIRDVKLNEWRGVAQL